MTRRRALLVPLVGALLVAVATVCAADPKDTIKNRKFTIQTVPYRDEGHRDPFKPLVPLRESTSGSEERVIRIESLSLSSVITGRRQVAVFKELHGPEFSYILVNGVLIGPDHKPIPGVAGAIEAVGRRGNYRVTLKQGGARMEFVLPEWGAWDRHKAGAAKKQDAKDRKGGTE